MAKTLEIFDMKGASAGQYTLEDNALELEKGQQAVHDVIVAFLAGERAGTACTKTRSERSGGGAKPFKQKGLGRARSGSIRNPVWRGGGIIFGPKPRSFAKKVNKKVRKLALKRAFSERVNEEVVSVLDEFKLETYKTKNVVAMLDSLKLESGVLFVVKDYSVEVDRATGNLSGSGRMLCLPSSSVNVYDLLRFKKVLFTKEALDEFIQRIV